MAFDYRSLVTDLELAWVEPPLVFDDEDFVEVRGRVLAIPDDARVENAIVRRDFQPHDKDPTRPTLAQASKGSERIEVSCIPAARQNGRLREGRVSITWRSGRRPPVDGPSIAWGGREWPVFIESASVYTKHAWMLILEGRIEHVASDAVLEKYKDWGENHGYVDIAPESAEVEPDMRSALHLRGDDFEVSVDPRGTFVLVNISLRSDRDNPWTR